MAMSSLPPEPPASDPPPENNRVPILIWILFAVLPTALPLGIGLDKMLSVAFGGCFLAGLILAHAVATTLLARIGWGLTFGFGFALLLAGFIFARCVAGMGF